MKNAIKLLVFTILALFVCTNSLFMTSQAKEYAQASSQKSCFTKSVKASHILVDTKAEADSIKSQIDNGTSFEAMAKKYSKCPSGENGGDLGYFQRGQMVKEFEFAAFDLPVGKVSEPVRTEFGWHLIKVTDRK